MKDYSGRGYCVEWAKRSMQTSIIILLLEIGVTLILGLFLSIGFLCGNLILIVALLFLLLAGIMVTYRGIIDMVDDINYYKACKNYFAKEKYNDQRRIKFN